MKTNHFLFPLAALLAACATAPKGPDVAVMPGPGKSFEQFQEDDRVCRDYAERSLGPSGPGSVATGAAVGTVLGAAAGAVLSGGRGGAVAGGAGMGLLMGSAVGSSNAPPEERDAQRRYDIAYEQCMSSKGNRIPAPPVTYYPYRHYHPPIVIYQQEPPPNSAPPPPPP
jgi:uncharacterized protein YcfJ